MSLTRDVPPDEQRRDADMKLALNSEDVLAWLVWRRDHEAADRRQADIDGEQEKWRAADHRCAKYAAAAAEILLGRERVRVLTNALKRRGHRAVKRGAIRAPLVRSEELSREAQRSRQKALVRAVRLELDTDLLRVDKDQLATTIARQILRAQSRWLRAFKRGTIR